MAKMNLFRNLIRVHSKTHHSGNNIFLISTAPFCTLSHFFFSNSLLPLPPSLLLLPPCVINYKLTNYDMTQKIFLYTYNCLSIHILNKCRNHIISKDVEKVRNLQFQPMCAIAFTHRYTGINKPC